MLQTYSTVDLPFCDRSGMVVTTMSVFAPKSFPSAIVVLDAKEVSGTGEEALQLLEGVRYEYEIGTRGLSLREEIGQGVVEQSVNPRLAHCGAIVPRSFVGGLALVVVDATGTTQGRAALEIRSRKLDYESDYRGMIQDITERCVELLMERRSPTTFRVEPDPGRSPSTIYQRFAFLRSLIGSERFRSALHRILTQPHHRWEATGEERDIRRGFRPEAAALRGLARSGRRDRVPEGHALAGRIGSLPQHVFSSRSIRTEDTPENRFVKFALRTFAGFLNRMRVNLEQWGSEADLRLRKEISSLVGELELTLAGEMFRNVSDPDFLPLGSPVLHRKEGYRELLQAWLNFELAARLVWEGGEDTYSAGRRDVATLYEYWVFFKLLGIVSAVCQFEYPLPQTLLEETQDGFGLRLKTGRFVVLEGTTTIQGRGLRVRLGYNQTFRSSVEYENRGSWTQRMRPDFTLTTWPATFSEQEAEATGRILHVHFDAKYRVEDVTELFGVDDKAMTPKEGEDDLDGEKRDQKDGRYKRADLLKMHAYRDAVRRSCGAYVIYPGDLTKRWFEYHEILPGLGAFPLRPGRDNEDLAGFVKDVLKHAADPSTVRERVAIDVHKAYARANDMPTVVDSPRG